MNTTACTTRAQKNRAAAPDTLVSVSCAMITSVANAGRFSIMFKCALCARCAQGAGVFRASGQAQAWAPTCVSASAASARFCASRAPAQEIRGQK